MYAHSASGKIRAGFQAFLADGHHVVKPFTSKLLKPL
jgi:hypothetical protein